MNKIKEILKMAKKVKHNKKANWILLGIPNACCHRILWSGYKTWFDNLKVLIFGYKLYDLIIGCNVDHALLPTFRIDVEKWMEKMTKVQPMDPHTLDYWINNLPKSL